ncbi:uncharacterized protein LOC103696507 isoform X2 [Phoenix dactylifera]|uniref:Uncharacterized protein LOC103696507 isoform X2 n=1 Tax=Phoenix dactylifera TaxID=42345 RepID=A0A8B8ZQT2_PHODC|nr:uncharacterized protein LOC103696507 isoform X2 [Phoenix dactylifera]
MPCIPLSVRSLSSSLLRSLLFLSMTIFLLYLLLFPNPLLRPPAASSSSAAPTLATAAPTLATAGATSVHHLLFGIASSARAWPRRRDYLRLWWRPALMRGFVFLDSGVGGGVGDDPTLPPTRVSADASRFPYSFKGGLRSAVRVARIAKELVEAVDGRFAPGDVRWIVLGDDDTVFFPENLAGTLAKYDWERLYYVGGRSEGLTQNMAHSFGMAFGGGGIAISYPLARALAKVLDSCLVRYAHLYGSDARIFACITELGVGLTYEPGFHQVDLRGDLLGVLSAHPLAPLVSLHHLDNVEPLFPSMNRTMALKHLFEAVNVDPARILQQTVCYDRLKMLTVSVSWGYTVQVFEGNQLLPDLLSLQQTFAPWRRNRNIASGFYIFNTREFPRDPCKRPAIFFLERVFSGRHRINSNYSRHVTNDCLQGMSSTKNLQQIRVSSQQLNHDIWQANSNP